MHKLHCLMFGWEFPPLHSGGLGVACEGLVRGLRKNGINVTLVLPHAGTGADTDVDIRCPTEAQYATIRIQSALLAYDDWSSFETRVRNGTMPKAIEDLYGPDLGAAVELFTSMSVDMTRDVHADVVHCHDWMTYEAASRAADHHDKPMVAHVHATEFDRTDFHPNPWIAERERAGLLRADRVIAVSGYTKNLLTKHYGIAGNKISVVHNGHEHRELHGKTAMYSQYGVRQAPMVLFLGRMTIQKNPGQFLTVARRMHDLRPDVRFVMAGDGPMLGELMERAHALGIGDCVLFTGKVSQREAQALFRRADCFVMPSLSEPFGLVALEAIAHGTPVVLSKQSGASEVIEHGFTVDFWDTDRMADCILTILREQPLAQQLKSEAPRILSRLTWQNQARAVRSVYEHAMHYSTCHRPTE